jgi:O-antigen ligase
MGVAGILAMALITPNFFSSVLGLFTGAGDDPSIESRTGSISLAAEFIQRSPWFGRGLGTFLPKYRIFDNEYILLLVSIGIIGTLAFLALAGTTVITLLHLRTRLTDDSSRDLALALTAAVTAGFSCLFMFDAFAFPMTMGALFLVLGFAGALQRTKDAAIEGRQIKREGNR